MHTYFLLRNPHILNNSIQRVITQTQKKKKDNYQAGESVSQSDRKMEQKKKKCNGRMKKTMKYKATNS